MSDRRKDTSTELSEVRTVLNRAITARCTFANLDRNPVLEADGSRRYPRDPENDEMAAALDQVIELLKPYAGRKRPAAQKWICHE